MKAVYKFFFMLMIFGAGHTNLYAQIDKIHIILKQPPPNQMGVGDMWNLELTNTTDKEIKIFLIGTASEDKDGLIIEGKSKLFTIKPGRSSYKYNDFFNAEVKYNNGKYKEIILRTGNAPEGSYTICVTAFDESGTEVGRENCIMQNIILGTITEIYLLHPCDLVRIDCDEPLIFTWTPMPKPEKYTFRLYETGKEDWDTDDDHIFRKKAIYEESNISGVSLILPAKIKLKEGKRYAWAIWAGDIRSKWCWFWWCWPQKPENPEEPEKPGNVLEHYYELTKEQLNSFVQVPKSILQVQYIDDYSSVENITSSIYNVESQQIVSTTQNIIIENINGVNRIKINLGVYPVVVGKSYLLVVSNFKSNYYLGFKIKN